VQLIKQARGI